VELGSATWRQVEATAGKGILALPLGSLEQHGPHLPLDTDTRIAQALAAGLADRLADVVVAPPVAYGASGEHAAFPGTLLLGH
jgi:creatinine amidohydrolase